MNKKVYKIIANVLGISLVALFVASCTSDADHPGHEYMPDMYRSPSIEPYVDYGEVRGIINDTLKMQLSAMTPPLHSIPYYGTDSAEVMIMLPYKRKATMVFAKTHGLYDEDLLVTDDPDEEYKKAAEDKNPIIITAANKDKIFATGKAIYESKCQHCHGAKGDGQGPMEESGAFSGAANLKLLTIADGQMFYSIYYGKGMMGSHRSLLNKKEIWTVIQYIHKLQNPAYDGTLTASVAAADSTSSK